MSRSKVYSDFVRRFCPEPATHATYEQIVIAEGEFGVFLPWAYCEFVTSHGPAAPSALLERLLAIGSEMCDIHSFLSLPECIKTTLDYQAAGAGREFFAFANDVLGNVFCFDVADLHRPRDDAPVWFFNHYVWKEIRLAESFGLWVSSYLKLP